MTGHGERQPAGFVLETLLPTAPGLPPQSGVPIDLAEVSPRLGSHLMFIVVVGAGSALLFAALTLSVVRHAGLVVAADLQLHSLVLLHRSDLSIEVARWLTWGGATIVTLPALVVIGALTSPPGRSACSRVGSGALLAGVASLCVYLGLAINASVGGMRPAEGDWAGSASGATFPSGHTTTATVFAAFAVWALVPRTGAPGRRAALVAAAVVYAGVVGITRVWLGVHWPSDVVGGWLFGAAAATLAIAGVVTVRRRWPRINRRVR